MTQAPHPLRLSRASLEALPAAIARPPARPANAGPGVVHLGLGAFHRAHQALVFDALLRAGDTRWGVLGVAMRQSALADALAAQDGLYSLQLGSAEGVQWRVPAALWDTAVASRDEARVVDAIASPATRWVTLTVTEKGYAPPLAQLLVQALAQRHAQGHAGLTVASCDNLSDNGRKLFELLREQALRTGEGEVFVDWLQRACAFPNSMVDRIVPAGSPEARLAAREALGVDDAAALSAEAYGEWVIERRFADPGDAQVLAGVGVNVVDDVGPFEQAKLRLLNGSHSAMACIGAVAGLAHISDCIAVPAVRRFVHGLMTHEVGPHLARADWPAYRDALVTRFGNPHLRHRVQQVASDSTQKIPQRWVPAALAHLAAGGDVTRLAFCAAAWMRHARGVDESGREVDLNDPLADAVRKLARQHAGDAQATFEALGALTEVWGPVLPHHPRWRRRVEQALQAIDTHGMLAALPQESVP